MADFNGIPILITGASGFVGANLTRTLMAQGADVHIILRKSSNPWRLNDVERKLSVHRSDLKDGDRIRDIVTSVKPEYIYHLAAPLAQPSSWDEREEQLRSIVFGTANLLQAIDPSSCARFIHIGSSLEYGPRNEALKESDLPEPSTWKGACKAAATMFCKQAARATSTSVVILRLFSVYGPWEPGHRLIPTTILSFLRNQEIRLTKSGFRRDLIHVDDVVEACITAARANIRTGEIINIGSGMQWTNEEVVDMIQDIFGRRIAVMRGVYPSRCSDTSHWVADIHKACYTIGWTPRTPLRTGLEKTVEWFHTHHREYYK